jgi:hypothetical protein
MKNKIHPVLSFLIYVHSYFLIHILIYFLIHSLIYFLMHVLVYFLLNFLYKIELTIQERKEGLRSYLFRE